MAESKNKVELKAKLKAKTDKLVSQDKELFANLSKEEITEKKKERAKGFREENRELLDKNKIMLLMEEYKKSGGGFSLYKEDPVTENEPNGWYDDVYIDFVDWKWYERNHWGELNNVLNNMDNCENIWEITEDEVVDTVLSLQKKWYISESLFRENKRKEQIIRESKNPRKIDDSNKWLRKRIKRDI
jgi:hypothetical protein